MGAESGVARRLSACMLLASAAMLGGCGVVGDLLDLQKPTARVTGVSLRDVRLDAATLLFDVEVSNPYSVALPLVNVDYALASKGASFLSGKADVQGTIPARSSRTVSLPARVTYRELLSSLQGVRPGAVVPYTAEMGLSVDAPAVGALRLPVQKSGELPVPAAPDVTVSEIRWDAVTLDRAGGTVRLAVVNRNEFPLKLSKLTYALSLGKTQVASTSLAKAANFAASGGAGELELPLSFSPKDAGLAVFRMLTGAGSDYGLTGTMDVDTPFGEMALPLDKVGKTLFRK